MNTLVPSAGTLVGSWALFRGVTAIAGSVACMERGLEDRIGVKRCGMTNSGTTAFYLILKVLKSLCPGRDEVILPAYTAPSLVLPIAKAGLRVVLCDVSLDTFNLDISRLDDCLTDRTLAVTAVHMFGLPCDVDGICERARREGAIVVEDAASSFGSRVRGRMTGGLSDVGFLSFNRGKNVSTAGGGCITTRLEEIATAVRNEIGRLPTPSPGLRLAVAARLVLLALAVRPLAYTALHRWISRLKHTMPHVDFQAGRYHAFQAGAGRTLLAREERIFQRRYQNGTFLMGELGQIAGLRVPALLDGAFPVYNQFPLLLPDKKRRDCVRESILARAGVETTILYPEPIHRMNRGIWDGSGLDPFPNATTMAERLLLVPTHPLVCVKRLERVVAVIAETMA